MDFFSIAKACRLLCRRLFFGSDRSPPGVSKASLLTHQSQNFRICSGGLPRLISSWKGRSQVFVMFVTSPIIVGLVARTLQAISPQLFALELLQPQAKTSELFSWLYQRQTSRSLSQLERICSGSVAEIKTSSSLQNHFVLPETSTTQPNVLATLTAPICPTNSAPWRLEAISTQSPT